MKKIKCTKCLYEWETKSKMIYVTCPSCQTKFRKEHIIKDIEEIKDGNLSKV